LPDKFFRLRVSATFAAGRRRAALLLFLLAIVGACATPHQQTAGPSSTTPHFSENSLIAADGEILPLRRWLPEAPPRAVILALHGFNDYSHAFDAPGQYWPAEASRRSPMTSAASVQRTMLESGRSKLH